MIEEDKFIYSPLGKGIKNQTKKIENQQNKQIKVLKVLKPADQQEPRIIEGMYQKEQRNNEIKKELTRMKRM